MNSAVYSPLRLILPPSSPRLKACKVSPLHSASLERLSNPEMSTGHSSLRLKHPRLTFSKYHYVKNNMLYTFANSNQHYEKTILHITQKITLPNYPSGSVDIQFLTKRLKNFSAIQNEISLIFAHQKRQSTPVNMPAAQSLPPMPGIDSPSYPYRKELFGIFADNTP